MPRRAFNLEWLLRQGCREGASVDEGPAAAGVSDGVIDGTNHAWQPGGMDAAGLVVSTRSVLTFVSSSDNVADMNDTYKIAWVLTFTLLVLGCVHQQPMEKIDNDTNTVPVNVSKAGGDIIQQQRIVNVSDGGGSLPSALWSVGGVGSILTGYIVWLVRHHVRRRRESREVVRLGPKERPPV